MLQWPVDKLTLINSSLALTGDNSVAVLDDGSDEYNVCSPAYERALAFMLADHSWSSSTKVIANLPPSPTAPTDDRFDTAYPLPPDLLQLIWVRLNDLPTNYGILAGQLVVNAQGGPPPPAVPSTPRPVAIKFISTDNSDVQSGTPSFVLSLQSFVMSGIYRGLHEDPGEADKLWQAGEMYLQRAKSRHDQQMPKRSFFNSRITAARRMRRPWAPTPPGWGGTGSSSS